MGLTPIFTPKEAGGRDGKADFNTAMFEKATANIRLLQALLPEAEGRSRAEDGGQRGEHGEQGTEKGRIRGDGGNDEGACGRDREAAANEELLAKARAEFRLVQR